MTGGPSIGIGESAVAPTQGIETSDERLDEFSLVRGGPSYRWLRHLGLVRHDGHDLRRLFGLCVAGLWLPLAGLATIEGLVRGDWDPLVYDLSVHARLLLSLPLLFATDEMLHVFCRRAMARFIAAGFAGTDLLLPIVRRAVRRRDSVAAELGLLVLVLFIGQLTLWRSDGASGLVHGIGVDRTIGVARVWYSVVALPFFLFVLGRLLWRWLIWSAVLRQLARLPLRLVVTHPDRAGGLSILAEASTIGLLPAVLATGITVAAAWGSQILESDVSVRLFVPSFLVLVAIVLAIAIGPLVPFARRLLPARLDGIENYGRFALLNARRFHHRWIDEAQREDTPFATDEVQSLADVATIVDRVKGLLPIPLDRRGVLGILVALLLPMLPLLATEMRLDTLVVRLGRALIGI